MTSFCWTGVREGDGHGLGAAPAFRRPGADQVALDDISEYAKICRVAEQRGRAPAVLLDCPHLKQTIDAAIAAGRL
jgi:hypothetical protein